MKIVYVGTLGEYGNCVERMRALEAEGHRVFPVDTLPWRGRGKWSKTIDRISWLGGWPRDNAGVNAKVAALAASESPDVVWIDKGMTVRRATLEAVRRLRKGVAIVHFNPDDPFGPGWRRGWSTFLDAIPAYDCHLVSRSANVDEYKAKGARHVVHELPLWGFDRQVHRPHELTGDARARYGCDVGFIGAFEEPRARMMLELGKAGIPVRIWGPWPEEYHHPKLQIETKPLFGDAYGTAISSFSIGLCFLRKFNRDEHTVRSVEIPACGTFMLAERTDDHLALFEEGKEAEFFSSAEEMIAKVRFYLANEAARTRIAQAGRERCLRSGYSNQELMAKRLKALTREPT